MTYAHADILEFLKKQVEEIDIRLLFEKFENLNKEKGE